MKAIVVYESFWGNTAAVARAIAEGLGPGTQVLTTDQATGAALAGVDLIVAGAPVLGFNLTTDSMRQGIGKNAAMAPTPPDLSHPSMRAWLAGLPQGQGRSAVFETRLRLPLGGATGAIAKGLEAAGYHAIAKPQTFVVKGTYGPLKDGELERAREWGAELARNVQS